MNTVKVKNIIIGEGVPKICVPIVGSTTKELIEEARVLKRLEFDIVEWRVDFFDEVEEVEKVNEALQQIRQILPQKPFIFTFRSLKEGGEKEITIDNYIQLNKAAITTGNIDIIDIELFHDEETIKTIQKTAEAYSVYTILSNHDFQQTPAKEEIISRLYRAQRLGADLPKIAVMPNSTKDVLTLLDATREMKENYSDRPMITMSMAGKGVISRLAGEIFGSAITFGSAQKTSAPGQVPVSKLNETLKLIHYSLS